MKKEKSNLTRILSIVGASLFLALSLILPFKIDNKHLVAYADSTLSYSIFKSSDIITATIGTNNSSVTSSTQLTRDNPDTSFWKFSFCIVADPLSSNNLSVYFCGDSWHGKNSLIGSSIFDNSYYLLGAISNSSLLSLNAGDSYYLKSSVYYTSYNTRYYSLLGCSITKGESEFPSLDMQSIEIGNYTSGFNIYFDSSFNTGYYNFVSYVDSTGWRFTYVIPFIYGSGNSIQNFPTVYYSYRKYYLTVDFTDNQFYQNGYIDGMADNQQNIYNDGYSAGNSVGYNNGYTAGMNHANNYSFNSLISSVIDVPVQTFYGLFNFDLLGVNLAGFFASLLSLAIIVAVIKLLI